MREIKVKAWSPSLKKWRSDWSISSYEEVLDLNIERMDDDLILVLYTGLKDKNGKDIYEGDIISGLHDYGPGGFHQLQAEVKFHIENGYRWSYWDIPTLEVIGNIYENPGLMEAK